MTAVALTPVLTYAEAEALTEEIRTAAADTADRMEDLVALVSRARDGHADQVLGHPSWTAYLAKVAGTVHAGQANRKAIARYLNDQGLSIRAIAPIIGVSVGTAHGVLAGVQNRTPDEDGPPADPPPPTIGLDGKTYPKRKREQEQVKVRRRPLRDTAGGLAPDLRKLAERVQRITSDDRFPGHAELIEVDLRAAGRDLVAALRALGPGWFE